MHIPILQGTWNLQNPPQSCSSTLGGICPVPIRKCGWAVIPVPVSAPQIQWHSESGRGGNAALPLQDWKSHSKSALQTLSIPLTE